MFGGLAFLIGGNMAVGASANGGVLVRVNPAESDTLTATTGPEIVEMRGRPMPGWLRIAARRYPPTASLPNGWHAAPPTPACCQPSGSGHPFCHAE